MDRSHRIRGVLIGLAAGDRIGGPLSMALCMTESLLARRRFAPADILERYMAWWREWGFDTGATAARVFRLIDSGVTPPEAVRRTHESLGGNSAGCNPAHRAPPLAMAGFLADEQLAMASQHDASLTHLDPVAGDVSAAVVTLCRALIEGQDWPEAAGSAAQHRLLPTRHALTTESRSGINTGGYAPDVLAAAVCFVGTSGSFPDALTKALQFAGPANYCPVLAGAIAGARWGDEAVPRVMLEHCRSLQRVRANADACAATWR